jgi:galactokinase
VIFQPFGRTDGALRLPLPEEIIVLGWPSGENLEQPAEAVQQTISRAQDELRLSLKTSWLHLTELTPELLEPLPLAESMRRAALFPHQENERCQRAVQLLQEPARHGREPLLSELGELLYQSSATLRLLGLGCEKTDVMVEALHEIGVSLGFYGARTLADGTVLVLMEKGGVEHLEEVRDALRKTVDPSLPLIF